MEAARPTRILSFSRDFWRSCAASPHTLRRLALTTTPLAKIEDLPDYPAFEQLARALWRQGTARGAAAFIGSGFSKFADRPAPDTPEPPIWGEFADAMKKQLYPTDDRNAPADALRLAEEYRIYFGQAALDEFIHVSIRDAAWQPGKLHRDLLGLEWSDILTTNWDTLLERTEESGGQFRYELVRCEADLAHANAPGRARRPRIVKLHGSIGTTQHFIVAEEDYRTYPVRFAAFVNLARQIFIENELCLLGFSGDDPNFLQWSGWVRDNLGDNARRIYLVGVLELGSAKRKLLESRNVAPIDLAPLVNRLPPGDRRREAARLFFEALAARRPKPRSDWKPAGTSEYDFWPGTTEDHRRQARDSGYAASLLAKASEIWARERETYPGWLICPSVRRRELRSITQRCPITEIALNELNLNIRHKILYEITWRHLTALWPVDTDLASLLGGIADPDDTQNLTREQCLDVAVLLLRTARQSGDRDALRRWSAVIERHSEPGTDLRAEVAYQAALEARDDLDFSRVKVEAARVDGSDPMWLVRKAALYTEIGLFSEAAKLIHDAVDKLNRLQQLDPGSLWIRSRRAWALWIEAGIRRNQSFIEIDESRLSEFRDARCDAQSEVNVLTEQAAGNLRKRIEDSRTTIPRFELGSYQDRSDSSGAQHLPDVAILVELDSLTEAAGVPLRYQMVGFVGAAMLDGVELAYTPSLWWYRWLLRSMRGVSDRQYERYFSRVAIAQLGAEITSELARNAMAAISYWRDRAKTTKGAEAEESIYPNEKMRLWIETLARLAVRRDPAGARGVLDLGCELARDASILHLWLYEPLANIITNAVQAIPPAERSDLVLTMIDFPLSDGSWAARSRWLDVTELLANVVPKRDSGDQRWNRRVSELIAASQPGSGQRAEAASRLAYLARHGALDEAESAAFAGQLWAVRDDERGGLPSDTNLHSFVFAQTPSPDTINAKNVVREWLFSQDIRNVLSPPKPLSTLIVGNKLNLIIGMSASAQVGMFPTPEQSRNLFDQIASLKPTPVETADPIRASMLRPLRDTAWRYLGEALGRVITPTLAAEDLTMERLGALIALVREGEMGTAAMALPYFSVNGEVAQRLVARAIHEHIGGRKAEIVAGGAWAIEIWVKLAANENYPPLPRDLVERVLSALENGREAGLLSVLHCGRVLIQRGNLLDTDRSRIANALQTMREDWSYSVISLESRQSVVVSLVRAECVRMARALEDTGYSDETTKSWLEARSSDPLPEVRFALDQET